MTNKELFLAAFARFAQGDADVLYTIVREDFVEHTPGNPSGRDAWVGFIKESAIAAARMELLHVVGDEEYVVAHYVMFEPGDEQGKAVADIWRFEDGMIVEHWDVVAPVPVG